MLILAGVSINAIIGENGLLTKSQYATFISEMAAVEEAVGMWKAGEAIEAGGQTTAIPTNGMCKPSDITSAERLTGEVGYYRVWNMSKTRPSTNILSSASEFNSSYSGELVTYPAGVQDLYYLNNEACGIDSKKTYLIDAATGMVYSMAGISLKDVSCYSSNMAKAVMNGDTTTPNFAEAEVSGSGSGEKLAGNVQSEFLEDGKTPNPEYNPNGFQIIANPNSNNIFKLYNNGDLYGKGIKGTQLNTSVEEMEKINANVWNEFKVPNIIPGVDTNNITIFPGHGTIYVRDKEGYLWAWGNNSSNKLGLTQEQQVEYTGREPVKLNVSGKKIKEVYSGHSSTTFVTTETNELYACGYNSNGNLGLGYKSSEVNEFTKIPITNVENIRRIMPLDNVCGTLIWYKDDTFYFAGKNYSGVLSNGTSNEEYLNFTKVYDGTIGDDIDQDVKDILPYSISVMILKKDGTIWQVGYRGKDNSGGGDDLTGSSQRYQKFPDIFGTNVTGIYQAGYGRVITRLNDTGKLEVWGTPGSGNHLGLSEEAYNSAKYWKIDIPEELEKEGIKEIFTTGKNVYYLSNKGKVYVSGDAITSGLNLSTGKVDGIVYSGLDNIKTLYSTERLIYTNGTCINGVFCFSGNDEKMYTIGNQSIIMGNDILQSNWIKCASNVKYFDGVGSYYVDKDNNLWVAGNSRSLGLGEISKNDVEIKNYIKCEDSNISGKVDKAYKASNVMYVLLNNKELWATGISTTLGNSEYAGWNEDADQSSYVKILDDIAFFTANGSVGRLAIKTTGEAYSWGKNYGGMTGQTGNILYPKSYVLPESILSVDNIKSINLSSSRGYLITKSGKLFMSGNWNNSNSVYDGGHIATTFFSQYTHNLSFEEKIVQIVTLDNKNTLILTDKGRIFGYGEKMRLGINSTSTELVEMQELTEINGVEQLVAGNGFYIAIKNDGTVWGTGSNMYGVLGRWKGAPRESGRYRTAFEWVECPELEI